MCRVLRTMHEVGEGRQHLEQGGVAFLGSLLALVLIAVAVASVATALLVVVPPALLVAALLVAALLVTAMLLLTAFPAGLPP